MTTVSKRTKTFDGLVDKKKVYDLKDAVAIMKQVAPVKFDQTVEVAVKLNVDPKQSSATVRGTVALPHGTGKKVKIAVFCKGEDIKVAEEAGADIVGADELINKVAGGWCDFDVAVATPVMMREMGKLGKVLGPRGLMPNPKAGTVTTDITKTINELKAGKIEFKMDKQANVNCGCGKLSFSEQALCENITVLLDALVRARPSSVKGHFIKSVSVSTTMGPGARIDFTNWR